MRFDTHFFRRGLRAAAAVLLLAPWVPVHALDPRVALADYRHDSWGAQEGAPSSIRSIAQSADGWIWLAAELGLYRFDGVRFERFEPQPGEGLLNSQISTLNPQPNGDLWIGYFAGGISVLRGGHLVHLAPANRNSPVAGATYNIVVDADGTAWVATTGGLRRFRAGRWDAVGVEAGLPLRVTDNVTRDARGDVWVSDGAAVYRLDRATQRFVEAGRYGPAIGLLTAPDGSLWHYDGKRLRLLAAAPAGWRGRAVVTGDVAQFDRDGNFWTTDGAGIGVTRARAALRGRAFEPAALGQERLPAAAARTVSGVFCEDSEGNVWVASKTGLERFRQNRVALAGVPNDLMFTVARDDAAQAWAVDYTGRLWQLSGAGAPRLAGRGYDAIGRGADGALLLANDAYVERRRGAGVERLPLPPAEPGAPARRTVKRLAGVGEQLLAIVSAQGLYRWRAGRWEHIAPSPQLPDGLVAIAADTRGQAWIGYRDNLVIRVDGERVLRYGPAEGVDLESVDVVDASDGVFIAGPSGAAILHGDRFVRVRADVPDVLAAVTGVAVAPNGDRFLSGAKGIVHVRAADWRALAARPERPLAYTLIGPADGYPGAPTMSGRGAAVDGAGHLWFASSAGVARLDTGADYRNLAPPRVQVVGLATPQQRYRGAAMAALPPGSSSLRIDYTALSFTGPERIRFRYRLDGVDRDWIDAGPRRSVYYTNLGPGTYRFAVTAENENGVASAAPATLDFEIAPTWTQTPAFYVGAAALALAGLYGLHRLRLRRQARRIVAFMDARQAERERIARTLHDTFLQSVQGLTCAFQAIADTLPARSDTRRRLEQVLDLAQAAIADGRDQVAGLRSASTRDIERELRDVATSLAQSFPVAFTFRRDGPARPVNAVVADEAYLVAREALFNAFRHAGAARVDLALVYGEAALSLSVADDGRGLDPDVLETGDRPGHWGLRGMRERAAAIAARLDIVSGPDRGTVLTLTIPAGAAYAS